MYQPVNFPRLLNNFIKKMFIYDYTYVRLYIIYMLELVLRMITRKKIYVYAVSSYIRSKLHNFRPSVCTITNTKHTKNIIDINEREMDTRLLFPYNYRLIN